METQVRSAPAPKKDDEMTTSNAVRLFAGIMTLLSVALTVWVSPYFIWFTVFIGANLIQSAFTGICLPATVFEKLKLTQG